MRMLVPRMIRFQQLDHIYPFYCSRMLSQSAIQWPLADVSSWLQDRWATLQARELDRNRSLRLKMHGDMALIDMFGSRLVHLIFGCAMFHPLILCWYTFAFLSELYFAAGLADDNLVQMFLES